MNTVGLCIVDTEPFNSTRYDVLLDDDGVWRAYTFRTRRSGETYSHRLCEVPHDPERDAEQLMSYLRQAVAQAHEVERTRA